MSILDLIVTSHSNEQKLHRFVKSVESLENKIHIIFVNQNEFPIDLIVNENIELTQVVLNKKVPLSVARNIGLQFCRSDILGFPDDDCWYSPNLLDQIITYFENKKGADIICTNVCDPIKNLDYGNRPKNYVCKINYNNVLYISVGIFINKDRVDQKIIFNENLGLGTTLGSGEESWLLIDCLMHNVNIIYNGYLSVYHEVEYVTNQNFIKARSYGVGFGVLLKRIYYINRWGFLNSFLKIFLRSICAQLFYTFAPVKRRFYQERMRGIMEGMKLDPNDIEGPKQR